MKKIIINTVLLSFVMVTYSIASQTEKTSAGLYSVKLGEIMKTCRSEREKDNAFCHGYFAGIFDAFNGADSPERFRKEMTYCRDGKKRTITGIIKDTLRRLDAIEMDFENNSNPAYSAITRFIAQYGCSGEEKLEKKITERLDILFGSNPDPTSEERKLYFYLYACMGSSHLNDQEFHEQYENCISSLISD